MHCFLTHVPSVCDLAISFCFVLFLDQQKDKLDLFECEVLILLNLRNNLNVICDVFNKNVT